MPFSSNKSNKAQSRACLSRIWPLTLSQLCRLPVKHPAQESLAHLRLDAARRRDHSTRKRPSPHTRSTQRPEEPPPRTGNTKVNRRAGMGGGRRRRASVCKRRAGSMQGMARLESRGRATLVPKSRRGSITLGASSRGCRPITSSTAPASTSRCPPALHPPRCRTTRDWPCGRIKLHTLAGRPGARLGHFCRTGCRSGPTTTGTARTSPRRSGCKSCRRGGDRT
mmetsp:Transcript_52147/g.104429  ORF Transcript_52147/g.104429 Transcript_52147/m.104429 type:complete len:224 (+) Transcript_52147:427-1098(+)